MPTSSLGDLRIVVIKPQGRIIRVVGGPGGSPRIGEKNVAGENRTDTRVRARAGIRC